MNWTYTKFLKSLKNKEWFKEYDDKYYHISGDFHIYKDSCCYIWYEPYGTRYSFNFFQWFLNRIAIFVFLRD